MVSYVFVVLLYALAKEFAILLLFALPVPPYSKNSSLRLPGSYLPIFYMVHMSHPSIVVSLCAIMTIVFKSLTAAITNADKEDRSESISYPATIIIPSTINIEHIKTSSIKFLEISCRVLLQREAFTIFSILNKIFQEKSLCLRCFHFLNSRNRL